MRKDRGREGSGEKREDAPAIGNMSCLFAAGSFRRSARCLRKRVSPSNAIKERCKCEWGGSGFSGPEAASRAPGSLAVADQHPVASRADLRPIGLQACQYAHRILQVGTAEFVHVGGAQSNDWRRSPDRPVHAPGLFRLRTEHQFVPGTAPPPDHRDRRYRILLQRPRTYRGSGLTSACGEARPQLGLPGVVVYLLERVGLGWGLSSTAARIWVASAGSPGHEAQ